MPAPPADFTQSNTDHGFFVPPAETNLGRMNRAPQSTKPKFDPSNVQPEFTQLDATKLALCLGVSVWIIKGMKIAGSKAGDSPFMGRYTTLRRATDWLASHREFVASHHLRN